MRSGVYTLGNFIFLAFMLLICIRSSGLIMYGYFLLCSQCIGLILQQFIKGTESILHEFLKKKMKRYIAIDLALQLAYQIPFELVHRNECSYGGWQHIFGFYPMWGPIDDKTSGYGCSIRSNRFLIYMQFVLFVLV